MTCWATLNPSTAATVTFGALRLPIVMTTWLSTRHLRFAGLQGTVQYSFKTDSKDDAKYTKNADGTFGQHYSGDEGTSHAKRYASIGLVRRIWSRSSSLSVTN